MRWQCVIVWGCKMIYLAVKDGKGWIGGSKQELVNQVAKISFLHKRVIVEIAGFESFELNYISKSEDQRNGFSASEIMADAYETVFRKLSEYGYFLK